LLHSGLTIGMAAAIGLLLLLLSVTVPEFVLIRVTLLVCLALVGILSIVAGRKLAGRRTFIGQYAWLLLIVAEAWFVRSGTPDAALAGDFDPAAYGEVLIWFCAFLAVLFGIAGRPGELAELARPPMRVLALFTVLALASSVFSPSPWFALAWAFKLSIVVLALLLCRATWVTAQDLSRFIALNGIAFLILAMAPLTLLLDGRDTAFSGPRLGGLFAPTGVSSAAGVACVIGISLMTQGRRLLPFVLCGVGSVMLAMGGGKAAIAAASLAVIIFFLVLRRPGSAAVAFLWLLGTLWGVFMFAPAMLAYLMDYFAGPLAATLGGRTELWASALRAIADRPLLGHGFVASKFVYGVLPGLHWPAGHMHNAFLEVLYNNGLVGLLLVLGMHVTLIRSLLATVRLVRSTQGAILAGTIFSLYSFVMCNALFTSTFGGRPHSGFMLFLGIYLVAAHAPSLLSRDGSSVHHAASEARDLRQ
jgi:O-antigen ligase